MEEMLRTEVEQEPYFPFVGNNLALDLIATQIFVRRKPYDLLQTLQSLQSWWKQALEHHPEELPSEELFRAVEWTEDLLQSVKELRVTLQRLFRSLVIHQTLTESELEPLNHILTTGAPVLKVMETGTIREMYITSDQQKGGLFLPIALSASRLIAQGERERIRQCDYCTGLFYDTSTNGTRRWCTEQCKNRSRSSRKYAQSKQIQKL